MFEVAKSLDISHHLIESDKTSECKKYTDFDVLISVLKEKLIQEGSIQKKLQMLKPAPATWTAAHCFHTRCQGLRGGNDSHGM